MFTDRIRGHSSFEHVSGRWRPQGGGPPIEMPVVNGDVLGGLQRIRDGDVCSRLRCCDACVGSTCSGVPASNCLSSRSYQSCPVWSGHCIRAGTDARALFPFRPAVVRVMRADIPGGLPSGTVVISERISARLSGTISLPVNRFDLRFPHPPAAWEASRGRTDLSAEPPPSKSAALGLSSSVSDRCASTPSRGLDRLPDRDLDREPVGTGSIHPNVISGTWVDQAVPSGPGHPTRRRPGHQRLHERFWSPNTLGGRGGSPLNNF
jgi:hypothetical protein